MAGGEGRRLSTLTRDTPKPLLRVSGKPILEHLLRRLRQFGVDRVTLAVAHMASKIEAYFGDGEQLGVQIDYLHEKTPLGTAGALGLLNRFDDSILMLNADILTDLDFHQLVAHHLAHRAKLTVASKMMHTQLSLGVLETDGNGMVSGYKEKPQIEHRVGIGIYVVSPQVREIIPANKRIDMPEVINTLLAAGKPVASYTHHGNWIDIGTPDEYARLEENHWLGSVIQPAEAAAAARSYS